MSTQEAGHDILQMNDSPYIDDFATCRATYATFLLTHPTLDPTAISRELGLASTRSHLRGHVAFPGGTSAPTGVWILCTNDAVASRDVRRHIDVLLDQLGPVQARITSLIAKGYVAEVSCYWASTGGHGGPRLDVAQLARLVAFGLPISFDVYFV